MGLTAIEKIIKEHTSARTLEDFVYADIDFCFGNDITAPLAVEEFLKAGFGEVFNPNKIGFFCDHFVPARDYKAANNVKLLRDFSKQFNLKYFFDTHQCGIEHVFLIEEGLLKPGQLVIGADSHTCTLGAVGLAAFGVGSTDLAAAMRTGKVWLKVPPVIRLIYKGKLRKWVGGKDLILATIKTIGVDGALYKVMEFSGPLIGRLGMEERLSMANMAVEAGAKTGFFEFDEVTRRYLYQSKGPRKRGGQKALRSDPDARYEDVVEIEASGLQPQVACPHSPSNVQPVTALEKIKIHQVVIGSCTNGRISDLRSAASILRGKKVARDTRCVVIPATHSVYRQAEEQGLLKVFVEAGCVVCPPSCGPCLGGHSGILDRGEVAIATTNRNFIGRMGHPESFVYLSSPVVAAASAIRGTISHPLTVAKR